MQTGEEQAWERLAELEPQDVCSRALVDFDPASSIYTLKCFDQDIHISLQDKEITGHSAVGAFLVDDMRLVSRLSMLWYLISAKDVPLSGQLEKPGGMPGGEIYSAGSHKIPLDKIAEEFGDASERFLDRGEKLGGRPLEYGDFSIQLFPYPRVPVVIAVWAGDEEFPPECTLLLDSTCTTQLPTDVMWATAMMTAEIVLCNAI